MAIALTLGLTPGGAANDAEIDTENKRIIDDTVRQVTEFPELEGGDGYINGDSGDLLAVSFDRRDDRDSSDDDDSSDGSDSGDERHKEDAKSEGEGRGRTDPEGTGERTEQDTEEDAVVHEAEEDGNGNSDDDMDVDSSGGGDNTDNNNDDIIVDGGDKENDTQQRLPAESQEKQSEKEDREGGSQTDKRTFEVTAYTNGAESTGKSEGHSDYGVTSSGNQTEEGVTAACPPSMEHGTEIDIESVGRRVCEDTGADIGEGRLDVFMNDVGQAQEFGRQTLKVEILD